MRRRPRSTRTDTLFPTRRSSDLYAAAYFTEARALAGEGAFEEACDVIARARRVAARRRLRQLEMLADICSIELPISQGAPTHAVLAAATVVGLDRSEEHTSELQSLMRISYAVFCLQKKNT